MVTGQPRAYLGGHGRPCGRRDEMISFEPPVQNTKHAFIIISNRPVTPHFQITIPICLPTTPLIVEASMNNTPVANDVLADLSPNGEEAGAVGGCDASANVNMEQLLSDMSSNSERPTFARTMSGGWRVA